MTIRNHIARKRRRMWHGFNWLWSPSLGNMQLVRYYK